MPRRVIDFDFDFTSMPRRVIDFDFDFDDFITAPSLQLMAPS